MKDKYLHTDLDICIKCDEAFSTPKGNGIRPIICGPCGKKIAKEFKQMNKKGIYLTPLKEKG